MALSNNPFGDVLKGLLDKLFESKGVNSPFRQGLPEQQPSISEGINDFNEGFKLKIQNMQRDIHHEYSTAAKDLDEFEGGVNLIPSWLFLLLIFGFTLFLLISFFLL